MTTFGKTCIPISWEQGLRENSIISGEAILAKITNKKFLDFAKQLGDKIFWLDVVPEKQATTYPIPQDLPQPLINALKSMGIEKLYSHQLETIQAVRTGKDVCLVTPTASGKTLCFNIPGLEIILKKQGAILYFYPLKELSNDQITELQKTTSLIVGRPISIAKINGDVSREQRKNLFINGAPDIICVTPDTWNHEIWNKNNREIGQNFCNFLRRLALVVVDEMHTYQSVFGANYSLLLTRTKIAVDAAGGCSDSLQFILASATIGNPMETARKITGRLCLKRLQLIGNSGAFAASKTLLSLRTGNGSFTETARLILRLLENDITGICFCNSRNEVKQVLEAATKEAQKQGKEHLSQSISIFIGSILEEQRAQIISGIKNNKFKFIISTSALEAGVNIPEIDAVVIRSFPGDVLSFKQRIGRAGRKNDGLIIFQPCGYKLIDEYYSKFPKLLFNGNAENIQFNEKYPAIVAKHILAAANECNLMLEQIKKYFGEAAEEIAVTLLYHGLLEYKTNGQVWCKVKYPQSQIKMRGQTDKDIKLIDISDGKQFEVISTSSAIREVFPGAIYTAHQNTTATLCKYQCSSLDLNDKYEAALVQIEAESKLKTIPFYSFMVDILQTTETREISSITSECKINLSLGWGKISETVSGYSTYKQDTIWACINKKYQCHNREFHQDFHLCPQCGTKLEFTDIERLIGEKTFGVPLKNTYETQVVRMEFQNKAEIRKISKQLQQEYEKAKEVLPETLLKFDSSVVGMHSIAHQLIAALPLVLLSSKRDLEFVLEDIHERNTVVGYFYETVEGSGACETLVSQFEQIAQIAVQLVKSCKCKDGCAECLYIHGCPDRNEALSKNLGIRLLETIQSTKSLPVH
ncbi:hypothetical protein WA1_49080 [Scytonema hofmannii PCC 7110]|uniref:DEAD/DEAH box helicase n=2 Tax=Scytonema hofmannii TaxID=34078 RepID=A0A139WQI1_9CYAN|nr:hypothetical protein WA1_49080 [Scytonema hofmannii PCC 7110]